MSHRGEWVAACVRNAALRLSWPWTIFLHNLAFFSPRRPVNETRRRSSRNKSPRIALAPPEPESEDDEEIDERSSDDDSIVSAPKPTKKRRPAPIKTSGANNKQAKTKGRPSPRGSTLSALAKKCLFAGELVDSSLLAALLASKNLSSLAAQVMDGYRSSASGANQVMVQLFNLLFRSVGSTPEACLDRQEVRMDDLSEDEWQEIIIAAMDTMSEVPINKVLLQTDPTKNKAFRDAYQEFFYQLALAALDDKEGIAETQINAVQALVHLFMVPVNVGQPDTRLAAIMALFSMTKAVLETTKDLNNKIDIGKRHLQVAKRNKSRVKADALSEELNARIKASEVLTELAVETIMFNVFAKRCKDSDLHIRTYCLETLGEFCLMRPDEFVTGRFLKYFGWFMHDKEPGVRYAAMHGLLVPLQAMRNKTIKFDKSNLTPVIKKFHQQIAKLVFDVAVPNQEKATELLLVLLREEYMDEIDDQAFWERINSRCLAVDASPTVRKNALYFVIAQCEQFDDDNFVDVYTEKRVVDRIGALATWYVNCSTTMRLCTLILRSLFCLFCM